MEILLRNAATQVKPNDVWFQAKAKETVPPGFCKRFFWNKLEHAPHDFIGISPCGGCPLVSQSGKVVLLKPPLVLIFCRPPTGYCLCFPFWHDSSFSLLLVSNCIFLSRKLLPTSLRRNRILLPLHYPQMVYGEFTAAQYWKIKTKMRL